MTKYKMFQKPPAEQLLRRPTTARPKSCLKKYNLLYLRGHISHSRKVEWELTADGSKLLNSYLEPEPESDEYDLMDHEIYQIEMVVDETHAPLPPDPGGTTPANASPKRCTLTRESSIRLDALRKTENDVDTMNDFLIDIMEEIEAENITVEACAETLERSGHLTIDEVLQIYKPAPVEDKIQCLLDILTNIGVDSLKRCRDSILLSMCTLPTYAQYMIAQTKLEHRNDPDTKNNTDENYEDCLTTPMQLAFAKAANEKQVKEASKKATIPGISDSGLEVTSSSDKTASGQSSDPVSSEETGSTPGSPVIISKLDDANAHKPASGNRRLPSGDSGELSLDSAQSGRGNQSLPDSLRQSNDESTQKCNTTEILLGDTCGSTARKSSLCDQPTTQPTRSKSHEMPPTTNGPKTQPPTEPPQPSITTSPAHRLEQPTTSPPSPEPPPAQAAANAQRSNGGKLPSAQERSDILQLQHRNKLRKLIHPETLKALLPILLDIGVVRAKQVWTLMNHQKEDLKIKELEIILSQLDEAAIEDCPELKAILQLCIPTGIIHRNKTNPSMLFSTSSSSDEEREPRFFKRRATPVMTPTAGQSATEAYPSTSAGIQSRVVKTALGNYQRQFNQSFMPQEYPPHYKQPSTSPRSSSPKENVSRSTSADSVSMLSSEELRTASTSSQNSNSGKHDDSDQSSQNEGSSITGRCGPTLTRKRSCRQNRVILDLIEKLRVEEQQQQERLRIFGYDGLLDFMQKQMTTSTTNDRSSNSSHDGPTGRAPPPTTATASSRSSSICDAMLVTKKLSSKGSLDGCAEIDESTAASSSDGKSETGSVSGSDEKSNHSEDVTSISLTSISSADDAAPTVQIGLKSPGSGGRVLNVKYQCTGSGVDTPSRFSPRRSESSSPLTEERVDRSLQQPRPKSQASLSNRSTPNLERSKLLHHTRTQNLNLQNLVRNSPFLLKNQVLKELEQERLLFAKTPSTDSSVSPRISKWDRIHSKSRDSIDQSSIRSPISPNPRHKSRDSTGSGTNAQNSPDSFGYRRGKSEILRRSSGSVEAVDQGLRLRRGTSEDRLRLSSRESGSCNFVGNTPEMARAQRSSSRNDFLDCDRVPGRRGFRGVSHSLEHLVDDTASRTSSVDIITLNDARAQPPGVEKGADGSTQKKIKMKIRRSFRKIRNEGKQAAFSSKSDSSNIFSDAVRSTGHQDTAYSTEPSEASSLHNPDLIARNDELLRRLQPVNNLQSPLQRYVLDKSLKGGAGQVRASADSLLQNLEICFDEAIYEPGDIRREESTRSRDSEKFYKGVCDKCIQVDLGRGSRYGRSGEGVSTAGDEVRVVISRSFNLVMKNQAVQVTSFMLTPTSPVTAIFSRYGHQRTPSPPQLLDEDHCRVSTQKSINQAIPGRRVKIVRGPRRKVKSEDHRNGLVFAAKPDDVQILIDIEVNESVSHKSDVAFSEKSSSSTTKTSSISSDKRVLRQPSRSHDPRKPKDRPTASRKSLPSADRNGLKIDYSREAGGRRYPVLLDKYGVEKKYESIRRSGKSSNSSKSSGSSDIFIYNK